MSIHSMSLIEMFLNFYKEYGQYINKLRALPSINDGMRPSERRILVTARETALNKLVKTARIVGFCIGKYHPHGDDSLVGVIRRFHEAGIMYGHGNWGFRLGLEEDGPGAKRYTEAMIPKESHDEIFKYIDAVDRVALELDPEPILIPVKFPMCMLMDKKYIGIGFGKRTSIPRYKKKDLAKRLLWLLGAIKEEPIIHPDYEEKMLENESKKLLTTGIGKFKYQAHFKISKKNKSIIITDTPLNTFNPLKNELHKQKYFDNGTVTILDTSKNKKTEVIVQVVKNKRCNFDELIKLVKNKITYTVTHRIVCYDEITGETKTVSIDEFLIKVFQNYNHYRLKSIQMKVDKVELKINNNRNLMKIKDFIVNKKPLWDNYDIFVEECCEYTNLDNEIIRELTSKYSPKQIIQSKNKIKELEEEKKILLKSKTKKETIKEYLLLLEEKNEHIQ